MKKILLWLALLFFLLGLLLFLGEGVLKHHGAYQFVTQHHLSLFVCRVIFYSGLILLWPKLIRAVGQRRHWPNEMVQLLAAQRLKLLCLFLLIEVFFMNNLMAHLFAWL